VVVIFDDNRPQQISLLRQPEEVFGNLTIESEYYIWVHKRLLGGEEGLVWLYDGADIFRTYKAKSAKFVKFMPSVYEGGVVHSVGPKEKKKGNYVRFFYPDGSVRSDYRTEPDIRKLNELRRR